MSWANVKRAEQCNWKGLMIFSTVDTEGLSLSETTIIQLTLYEFGCKVLARHMQDGDLLQMNTEHIHSSSSPHPCQTKSPALNKCLTKQAPINGALTDRGIRYETSENERKLNWLTPDCTKQPGNTGSLSWGNVSGKSAASSWARQSLLWPYRRSPLHHWKEHHN